MPSPKPETGAPCPICGKPDTPVHRPFCSRRCADVDLGRWLTGQYRVPGAVPDTMEEASEGTPESGAVSRGPA